MLNTVSVAILPRAILAVVVKSHEGDQGQVIVWALAFGGVLYPLLISRMHVNKRPFEFTLRARNQNWLVLEMLPISRIIKFIKV